MKFLNGLEKDDVNFQTPNWVAEKMVGHLAMPKGSTVLEPTPGAGNLVKVIEDFEYVCKTPICDFWDLNDSIHSQKFDAVVMNPPFTKPKYAYDILWKCAEYTNLIIALMPWVTLINSQKRTKEIVDFGLMKVIHLPRNAFPGIRMQTMVLILKSGFKGETILEFI